MPAPMLQFLHRRHEALKPTLAAHKRARAVAARSSAPATNTLPVIPHGSQGTAAGAGPSTSALASSPLSILACSRRCRPRVAPAPLYLRAKVDGIRVCMRGVLNHRGLMREGGRRHKAASRHRTPDTVRLASQGVP